MKNTYTVKTKFWVFPVNSSLQRKDLGFYIDGERVFELAISLDPSAPTFLANVNVERFWGKEITLDLFPDGSVSFTESDEPMFLCEDGDFRPKLSFTASSGWTNDPNGLYKYGGEYHLFYQHNPCDLTWDNMHWGHAKSRDLLHWEELDEFLYPDENGAAYSGSAFVDKDNSSGLKRGADDPILIYYTTAPKKDSERSLSCQKKWTQRILASTDGGKSFDVLPEFIGEICEGNRDPRVEYSPELGKYVLALYISEERRDFAIFTSDDLKNWEELQRITLGEDRECPNFARYKVENSDEYKWVFYGANSVYSVYEIKDGLFREVQAPKKPYYATSAYAAQNFTDPDTKRRLRIDWVRSRLPFAIPRANFSQLFSIPKEERLVKDAEGYSLTVNPTDEILSLASEKICICDAARGDMIDVCTPAFIMNYKAEYETDGITEIYAGGRRLVIDTGKNKITSRLESCPAKKGKTVDITVVSDTLSLEIFADGGRFFTASISAFDKNSPYVMLCGDVPKGAQLSVAKLKI